MQLVNLNFWKFFQGRVSANFTALTWTIVNDRHLRIERSNQSWIVAAVHAVMIDLIYIYSTRKIPWADEFVFYIPSKVAAIEVLEPSITEQDRNALRVVALIFRHRLKVSSTWNYLRGAGGFARYDSVRSQ